MVRKGTQKSSTLVSVVLGIGIIVFLFLVSRTKPMPTPCTEYHSAPDAGDCQALNEMRRPKWACFSAMKKELPYFLSVYKNRPIKNNYHGMRLDHSFAVWYILRTLKPKFVIESGAWLGHSTWLIRTALPNARIISCDPRPVNRRLAGVEYYTGKQFVDFKNMDWIKMGVNPAETVVFLDDHISGFYRIFRDNKAGFKRFFIEDSYDYSTGDNYNLKWVCERQLRNRWPGYVPQNFKRVKTPLTWEQNVRNGEVLKKSLNVYYEFPPLASASFTKQTWHNPKRASTPIIRDRALFDYFFKGIDKVEFNQYTYITYVELKPDAVTSS